MLAELAVLYLAYLVYLALRRDYLHNLERPLRGYARRRRVWVGLTIGPIWFLLWHAGTLPGRASDRLIQAIALDAEYEQLGGIGAGARTVMDLVLVGAVLLLVALWVLFCLVMAWRNVVAMKTERRHIETIAALEAQLRQAQET